MAPQWFAVWRNSPQASCQGRIGVLPPAAYTCPSLSLILSVAIMDSQRVKTIVESGLITSHHGVKQVKAREQPLLVDTLGSSSRAVSHLPTPPLKRARTGSWPRSNLCRHVGNSFSLISRIVGRLCQSSVAPQAAGDWRLSRVIRPWRGLSSDQRAGPWNGPWSGGAGSAA
jgi:hypothetical protein